MGAGVGDDGGDPDGEAGVAAGNKPGCAWDSGVVGVRVRLCPLRSITRG